MTISSTSLKTNSYSLDRQIQRVRVLGNAASTFQRILHLPVQQLHYTKRRPPRLGAVLQLLAILLNNEATSRKFVKHLLVTTCRPHVEARIPYIRYKKCGTSRHKTMTPHLFRFEVRIRQCRGRGYLVLAQCIDHLHRGIRPLCSATSAARE